MSWWNRANRELDDEVQFHLDMQIEDNIRAGMSPEEARYAARRSFGGIQPMKEAFRDQKGFPALQHAWQDVRYALRTLWRTPGYTLTAVTVLALAIGVNTAMFSVLDTALLRPLPFPAPEQLTMLWSENPGQGQLEVRTAYQNIEEWRGQSQSFTGMAIFDGASSTLLADGRVDQISVLRVSANIFSLLGFQPAHGRAFTADEAEKRQRVALISHRFWLSRFGGAFDAIGSPIELNGQSSRIVGILPDGFQAGILGGDVWEPHTLYSDWETVRRARGTGFWSVIGRLRPGVTIKQAQAEMSTIARRVDGEPKLGISVAPMQYLLTGARPRLALWMLGAAVFFVLLIAATNVASLTLARSAVREREMAVRAALGASRSRIVRQLLAESMTLAALAGLLGLALAWAGIRGIQTLRPAGLARIDELSLDPRVLAAAMGICLITGILVGLIPAILGARRNAGGRGIAGGAVTTRIRRALVVTEFALAIMLLVGAGLSIRSLWSVEGMNPGFRAERVLSVALAPPPLLPVEQRAGFYGRVLEKVRALPGVESAGITSELFISGGPERPVLVEGDAEPVTERLRFRSDELSDGLFETIGTPLLQGRNVSAADGSGSQKVVVINETMARRLWPGRDPVGRRMKPGAGAEWLTVVGVVGDMRRQGLESAPQAQMFEALGQNPPRRAVLAVRTATEDPLLMAGAVQAAVRGVEKFGPVYAVTTMENQLGAFLTQRRFQTSLLLAFAAVAMLMAAIGIYGLIQYSITARTHEIGIRMAIGAQTGEIFRMVIGEGLRLSGAGLVAGLVGAWWLGQAGSSLLFGVTATDPLTFGAVSLLLFAVAIGACYFPARRAMRVEPVVALRQE